MTGANGCVFLAAIEENTTRGMLTHDVLGCIPCKTVHGIQNNAMEVTNYYDKK